MTMRASAGLGFKPQHLDAALAARADGLWFELHPENYYVDGGPRLALLDRLRDRYPVALHGVSLSLASSDRPDASDLRRLRALCDRIEPCLVSEHLAWSRWQGVYVPDLLPAPRTRETVACICRNVELTQTALQRPLLIENPTHYLALPDHEIDEIDFLTELCSRTGCRLLLDVNNVHISARNLGFDAATCLDGVPAPLIAEIHLAGHRPDEHSDLLIDSHDAAIDAVVWALYERLIARIGPRPTLIERDAEIPPFADLLAERDAAAQRLHAVTAQTSRRRTA